MGAQGIQCEKGTFSALLLLLPAFSKNWSLPAFSHKMQSSEKGVVQDKQALKFFVANNAKIMLIGIQKGHEDILRVGLIKQNPKLFLRD